MEIVEWVIVKCEIGEKINNEDRKQRTSNSFN
jgi:hypothetical protein